MERYSYYRNTESGAMYKIDNHREDSISMMLNMAYEPLVNATADEYGKYVANNYKSPVSDANKEYRKADFRRYGKVEVEDLVVCPYCFEERELHTDEFEHDSEFEDEEYCEECGQTYKIEAEVRFEFWATTRRLT